MFKLLTALLLSAASMTAMAAPTGVFSEWAANPQNGYVNVPVPGQDAVGVYSPHFYITDPTQIVLLTFVSSDAGYDLNLFVRPLDENGSALHDWQQYFAKEGDSVGTNNYWINPSFASFAGAKWEIDFRLDNSVGESFYNNVALNADGVDHAIAFFDYYDGQTLVGFEDLLGGGDRDYDDLVFLVSNVQATPRSNAVPEPASLALLLAGGLGLLSPVFRRRRGQ
ncbi:MAG: DUF4114 domain-containing protein [Azoarcus sp.]|jgi:hypothetical protein|nr:DUF4114 domain-containing protein [Azoarcus sp.]